MNLSNSDLDVFFHMRNHYIKLRNAKSTFVFSSVKARVKSSCSLSGKYQKIMEFEEKHFQNQEQLPCYDDRSTNMSCLYNSNLNNDSTLVRVSRPSTRRHPDDLPPPQENFKPRCVLEGKTSRPKTKKFKKSNKSYSNMDCRDVTSLNSECSCCSKNKKIESKRSPSKCSSLSNRSEPQEEKKMSNCVSSPLVSPVKKNNGDHPKINNKIEEHEYLLFLLRVTEDIIMNNYYANEDIERVFKEHMEMNKDRLIKEKMEQHLAKLADELHIVDAQTNPATENFTSKVTLKPQPSYTNIQTLKTYPCECTSDVPIEMSFYPLNEYNYYSNNYQNNLDEIIYFRHSLGRVTECTEPSSSTTIAKAISSVPTKSNMTLPENIETDDPNRKLFDTRSEILNPIKSDNNLLRNAISENIVHHHTVEEKLSPVKQNNVIEEEDSNSYEEDKDCDTEKSKDRYKSKNSNQNVNTPNSDAKENIEETTDENKDTDYSYEKVITRISEDFDKYKNEKSDFDLSTVNTPSTIIEDIVLDKFKTEQRNNIAEEFKRKRSRTPYKITNRGSVTEYSGFTSDINADSSDINTDNTERVKTKRINQEGSATSLDGIGDCNVEKHPSNTTNTIAEKGDYECLQLNLNFKDSIDSFPQETLIKDVDVSIQTCPAVADKSTDMSCSFSDKACSTDEDAPADQDDYVLITNPIYVLKSVIESRSNIIKLIEPEEEVHAELLGSDYDLTPERDTADKYHYLMADVSTSMSHVQIPSLSSIQEESLLLGNLYDLQESSSQEFELNKDWDVGSATYRCTDHPKALSCDDEIFLKNSEVLVCKNWLSDKSELPKASPKKRIGKLKHVRAHVNVTTSTSSSASLTC